MSAETTLEKSWYLARHLTPDAIICCRHGTIRACKCVRWFNVDKNYPLTQLELIIRIATLELNRMNRLGIDDTQKSDLLIGITQSQEGEQSSYIEEYERLYHALVPKQTIETPESNPVIELSYLNEVMDTNACNPTMETTDSDDLINTALTDVSLKVATPNYFINFGVQLLKYILILCFFLISPIFFLLT